MAVPTRYVKGPLSGVGSYTTSGSGALGSASSFDISPDNPGLGTGFYYVFKEDDFCQSWQTSVGAEPGRDVAL